jgi:SLT domain-containing protein
MQTIQPTFDAYRRYSIDRYGSVSNVPGLQSMNGGGYVGY